MSTDAGSYSTRSGLSKSWKVDKSHRGIYTGGKVETYERDGESRIACMLHDDVAILDAATGELQRTLQQDVEDEEQKEAFVTFTVRPKHNQLVTAGRNLLLRLWDLETFTCIKTIKAHETPALALTFDPTGTLLATGGSDRSVRVFDIDKGYCTHSFRKHSAIVTNVTFHPDPNKLLLVSCSDDTTVRIWDLYSQREWACIEEHMSPATCVAFSQDGYTMLTSGRDKVVNFWDLRDNKLQHTVLVHEGVEGIQVLPSSFSIVQDEGIHFVTAGDSGQLRMWKYDDSGCTVQYTREAESDGLQFSALVLDTSRSMLIAVTSQQNFLVFNDSLDRTAQIIGYNDDILNLKYIPHADGSASDQLAVATNSEEIRLLNRSTLSCELLSGHTDIVMALSVSPDGKWLVSASKDRTAKLWDVENRKCVGTATGHTESLAAVAISQKASNYSLGASFFVTGSSDKTLKMWSLKALASAYSGKQSVDQLTLSTMGAAKAHDKDINALAVAPNDRFIASASQDKTIKVWNAVPQQGSNVLTLAGTCQGHKRGVWAVEFSPVDQCLASASGDRTIKLWSAKDFTCLKTFEGHTASVLGVQFVCAGMQLVSAGADGLLKLWTIRSNECEATLDEHEDKIWALAATKDSSEIASGGSDSTIHLWHDFTAQEQDEKQKEEDEKVLKEQQLSNCLRNDKLLDAVQLAFDLGYPHRMLQILRDLLEGPRGRDYPSLPDGGKIDPDAFTPEDIFAPVVNSLSDEQLTTLLTWAKDWNTNARHSSICQVLFSTLLREIPPTRWTQLEQLHMTLQALIAYNERHFQRLDRMLQKSYLVDFSIVSMKNLFPQEEEQTESPVVVEMEEAEEVVEAPKKSSTRRSKRKSGAKDTSKQKKAKGE